MSAAEPGPVVGKGVRRKEDERLLAGRGRYVGRVRLPGMAHAVVVRSPVAHGRVVRCDAKAARAVPGVLDVITAPDAAGVCLPCIVLAPGQRITSYPVLENAVRYAGQPLAMVVARTPEIAARGAALLELDFERFPAVTDPEHALGPDAPRLYAGWDGNVLTDLTLGDADCDEVFAAADHVVEMTFRFGRLAPYPLEPRGVVASFDGADLTIWISTQVPHGIRQQAAAAVGLSHDRVHVVAGDAGGAFGAKDHLYPDEALACLAAVRLGVPVGWTEEPGDRLAATLHARSAVHRGRLGLDARGRFLALHADVIADLGAHPSNIGIGPAALSAVMLPGPYRFEHAGARVRGVVTTTTPTGSYRGYGQPECTLTRERLIDEAARLIGLDPVELRLSNLVTPGEMPYRSRVWQTYDSGDYPLALRTLRDMVAPVARADGRARGVGFSCHVESTGLGPSMELKASGINAGGYETAVVRMEPDTSVVVATGLAGFGQGLETTLAQIAADRLAVPLDRVRVLLGNTDATPYSGLGGVGSRSMAVGGAAVALAAGRLRAKILAIAAHLLDASPDDLVADRHTIRAGGGTGAQVTLEEIVTAAWRGWDLPPGHSPGLEERVTHDPAAYAFAYGAHAAAVAVDTATGQVEVEGYWVVSDSGVLVNPAVVEGQIVGGVAQSIGMALTEEIVYTEDGRPVLDYLLPTARDVPAIQVRMLEIPSPVTPGGMKGAGEAGTLGPPAAIANAVAAALPHIAGRVTRTPITSQRVWRWLTDDRPPGGASEVNAAW
ncbi:xanthine dehydrogenase family protein molybdopterin-binding subunit [Sphaerisporangium sp. B11E5]|uniref:xanthine dehydrogenase family protein molybdopterin-binding subunit n=1 Tax=Sphaerisporangium sp. B11E5 TaxID=3153563 RepID=UPI00325D2622